MRREDIELFKQRALSMHKMSKEAILNGSYDLAAFLAEQAAQLYVKYKILELTGEMPRTHVLRQLLAALADCLSGDRKEAVISFIRANRSLLIRLEEAYIASRYLIRRYDEEETEELVDFAGEVIDFVSGIQVQGQDGRDDPQLDGLR